MKRTVLQRIAALAAIALLSASSTWAAKGDWAQRLEAESDIDRLGRLYLELLLEEDPTGAAQIGVHGRDDDDYYYDRRLPDPSQAARAHFAAQREALQKKLETMDVPSMTRPEQIDHHILTKRIAFDRMVGEELKSYQNPLSWTGTLGSAFSGLVLRDYAPVDERLTSFGSRCEQTPAYLAGARATLEPESVTPPEMNKAIALSNLQGLTREGTLFDKTLPELLATSGLDSEQAKAIESNCAQALAAINEFAARFEETVSFRQNGAWRLGKEICDRKYDLQLDYRQGGQLRGFHRHPGRYEKALFGL